MQSKQMVRGFPCIKQPTISCESCVLEKNHRGKFVSSVSYRAKVSLEFFHTNLCGLMQTPTLARNVYFLLSLMIIVGRLRYTS